MWFFQRLIWDQTLWSEGEWMQICEDFLDSSIREFLSLGPRRALFYFLWLPLLPLLCVLVGEYTNPVLSIHFWFQHCFFSKFPSLIPCHLVGLPIAIPDFSHYRIGCKTQAWPIRLHHFLGLRDWLMDEIMILEWPIRALPSFFFSNIYRYKGDSLSPWM